MYKIKNKYLQRKALFVKANVDISWWFFYFKRSVLLEILALSIFRHIHFWPDFKKFRQKHSWNLIIFIIKKMTYIKQRKTFYHMYRKISNSSYGFDGYWKKMKKTRISLDIKQPFLLNRELFVYFRENLLDKKKIRQRDKDIREGKIEAILPESEKLEKNSDV